MVCPGVLPVGAPGVGVDICLFYYLIYLAACSTIYLS